MKKAAIIGSVLLTLGMALFLTGFFLSGGNIRAMKVETSWARIDFGSLADTEYTYPADGVGLIDIETVSGDVWVRYSRDDLIHVLSEDGELELVPPENGVLTVSQKGDANGKFFSVDFGSGDITVLVPENSPLELSFTVTTVSGDIFFRVNELSDTENVELGTTSGDIAFPSLACGSLRVRTVSGDILGALPGAREDYTRAISTVSGDANIRSGGDGERLLAVSTVSGDIRIKFTGK